MEKISNNNLLLIAMMTKAATGVLGASLILTEQHPFVSLLALSFGAAINEYLLFVEKSKNKKQ